MSVLGTHLIFFFILEQKPFASLGPASPGVNVAVTTSCDPRAHGVGSTQKLVKTLRG